MIVCSECEFENPKDHRFCQQCGAPLSVWRAILTYGPVKPSSPDGDDSSTVDQMKLSTEVLAVLADRGSDKAGLASGKFLDPQQRYQLLEEFRVTEMATEVLVLDTQVDKNASFLERCNPEQQQQLLTQVFDVAELPGLVPMAAYPYLSLQERFFPSVPELHDVLVDQDCSLILIEDRNSLPRLLDVWSQATLEPLQQVHGMYTMVELWESLSPFQGQVSLLKLDNLCIDEDQIFCLRRIDCSPTPTSHTLQDLGLLWQSLLHSSAQAPTEIVNLVGDVSAGLIDAVEPLKDRLVEIADQLQSQNAMSIMPEADAPDVSVMDNSVPIAVGAAESSLDMLEQLGFEGDSAFDEDEESIGMATMVLPMKLIGLEEAGQTHVGQQRDHNEDAFFIQSSLKRQDGIQGQKLETHSLYILCDGMGGHAGGEVASRLAVEALQNYFTEHWESDLPSESQLREAVGLANQVIYERNLNEERSGSARMGTTLVLVLVSDTHAVVAHVGDSRLYRYSRRLGLQQVTVDHEVGQREIQRGVEPAIAYARPDAYQLTQALGPRDQSDLDPGITYLNLTEDTLFILCSDGLSDHDLLEVNCRTHVEPMLKGPNNIEEGIAALIDLANEVNGHDNITAVAVKLKVKPNLEKMQMG